MGAEGAVFCKAACEARGGRGSDRVQRRERRAGGWEALDGEARAELRARGGSLQGGAGHARPDAAGLCRTA